MSIHRILCLKTILISGLALSGCQHTTSNQAYLPALAPKLTPEQFAEVTQIVTRAVNRDTVLLSTEVFATGHILVLSPSIANTPLGRIATSRTLTKGETFHLVSNGRECAIQHLADAQLYALSFACTPISP